MTHYARVGDLVLVEWHDAATAGGHEWREEKDLTDLNPPKCETVGWVHRIMETGVLLISTRDNEPSDKSYWGEITIPWGTITKLEKLRTSCQLQIGMNSGKAGSGRKRTKGRGKAEET